MEGPEKETLENHLQADMITCSQIYTDIPEI